MAIKLKHSDSFSTYFITFTCAEWIPLFKTTSSYDIVYDWFNTTKEKYNGDVVAYVIMPNHLHVILHFQQPGFDLNAIISNGKRFMAYEIVNRLEATNNTTVLNRLSKLLTDREKKKGQLHKVFKDSFDAKAIITQAFLMQKINYIHNNPVSGKWMLAKDFIEYEHSSASFYEMKEVKHFKPLHYLDILIILSVALSRWQSFSASGFRRGTSFKSLVNVSENPAGTQIKARIVEIFFS